MLSVEDQKIYSIISANMARLTKIFKYYLDKECFTFDPEGLKKLREEQTEKEEQTKKEMISAIREAIETEKPDFSADLDLAKRVFDIVPAWDREEWETVETTAETICTNPAIVIMNELQNMILIDVKEALFNICFKYEKILGVEFNNGVNSEIENMAAEAIFDIARKARFEAMDEMLRSDSSYSDIVDNLPGIEGLTVAEFVRLCYRSNLNYRIVKESSGGKTEIVFEMIDDLKSGSWDDEEMKSAILQKIECEEDGDEGFFILTYYKR